MMPTFAELADARIEKEVDGLSALDALLGQKRRSAHEYLYWDYGHCRAKFAQAVRLGKWKGIRIGRENPIELYDLTVDLGEAANVASVHPDVVRKIEGIMKKAYVPSDRYPLGKIYRGQSKWVERNARH